MFASNRVCQPRLGGGAFLVGTASTNIGGQHGASLGDHGGILQRGAEVGLDRPTARPTLRRRLVSSNWPARCCVQFAPATSARAARARPVETGAVSKRSILKNLSKRQDELQNRYSLAAHLTTRRFAEILSLSLAPPEGRPPTSASADDRILRRDPLADVVHEYVLVA